MREGLVPPESPRLRLNQVVRVSRSDPHSENIEDKDELQRNVKLQVDVLSGRQVYYDSLKCVTVVTGYGVNSP